MSTCNAVAQTTARRTYPITDSCFLVLAALQRWSAYHFSRARRRVHVIHNGPWYCILCHLVVTSLTWNHSSTSQPANTLQLLTLCTDGQSRIHSENVYSYIRAEWNRGRTVGTVIRTLAGQSGVQIPAKARDFSLPHTYRLFSGYRSSFKGHRRPKREVGHSHLSTIPSLGTSGAMPLLQRADEKINFHSFTWKQFCVITNTGQLTL